MGMAQLIEIKTPEKYAKKGRVFQDWTLDTQSLGDNCKRIADEMRKDGKVWRERTGKTRPIAANDILGATSPVVTELGAIVRGHRDYMKALGSATP